MRNHPKEIGFQNYFLNRFLGQSKNKHTKNPKNKCQQLKTISLVHPLKSQLKPTVVFPILLQGGSGQITGQRGGNPEANQKALEAAGLKLQLACDRFPYPWVRVKKLKQFVIQQEEACTGCVQAGMVTTLTYGGE